MRASNSNIVVTAANDKYSDSLIAMLHSIRPIRFTIGILDLGLSTKSMSRILKASDYQCSFIDPGWCIPIPRNENTPEYKKVFLAKPYIPDLFPNFSAYLWVDADIWFQDSTALEDYFEAAAKSGMAICYEDHPHYTKRRKKGPPTIRERLGLTERSYKLKRVRKYFGSAMARKYGNSPTMNSGIFCITAQSSIWRHWQEMMQKANLTGHERKRLICDQTCFDLAVLINNFSPTKMPATHNWCIGLADPMALARAGQLVDPVFPHNPIKVFHSAGSIKMDFGQLKDRYFLTSSRQLADESISKHHPAIPNGAMQ